MRSEIAHLTGKRIRARGTIVNIELLQKRKTQTYRVTLCNVEIDQSRAKEPIDHINVFLPVKSIKPEIIESLTRKKHRTITFTAEVYKYKRRPNKDHIYTTDYGLCNLKKIEMSK